MRLLRHRRVDDLGWAFCVLNFVGLAFLAARSAVIHEWAFLAINLLTTTFWGLVVVVKAAQAMRPDAAGAPSGEPIVADAP